MTIKKIVFTLLIFCSVSIYAQDTLSYNEVFKQYSIALELTKEQKTQFNVILEKYKSELYNSTIEVKSFNKTNKLRDLEFYKVLSKEQFSKYKKAKLEIEPTLKYRY